MLKLIFTFLTFFPIFTFAARSPVCVIAKKTSGLDYSVTVRTIPVRGPDSNLYFTVRPTSRVPNPSYFLFSLCANGQQAYVYTRELVVKFVNSAKFIPSPRVIAVESLRPGDKLELRADYLRGPLVISPFDRKHYLKVY